VLLTQAGRNRLHHLTDESRSPNRSRMASPMTTPESLVHARGLTKRYANGFTAVDAVDFDVRPGKAFGFLGPNGAGKTSTMRMIACSSPVTEGELQRHRHGSPHAGARDQGAPRGGAADRQPRHRADGPREPRDVRALFRHSRRRVPRARRRAARVRPARRAREGPGGAAVGRHEAAPDDRPRPHQRSRPRDPRRADHRPRPAGAAPSLGAALPAEARGGPPSSSPRTTWTRPSSCATTSS
jgi:hypothetical protein